MKDLKGKRLLLLGGSLWKDVIKQFADENEIVLLATGNNQDAGIFHIADEKYNVDSTNGEAIKELIKKQNIDGVYMGGSEIVIEHASKYLEELDMPCYCKNEQWQFLQNKSKFKNVCKEHGLPVVPAYNVDIDNPQIENDNFPVIVKPVDGNGSQGFSICENNEDLALGCKNAVEHSISKNVIVEKLVKNDANVVFYTISNGKIHFSGLSDKYPVQHKKHGSFVGGLFLYKSNYTDEFRRLFEDKIQNMIDTIGLKEGSLWIEVFHNEDEYYFNEAGYRYGGSASIYPTDYFYNINQVVSDIYYALTGESKITSHSPIIPEKNKNKKHYAIYPIHVDEGKITEIKGLDKLEEHTEIVTVLTTKNIGDVVKSTGSFQQAYALIHMKFDDMQEFKNLIEYIHTNLEVLDENKCNLILEMLDPNKVIV